MEEPWDELMGPPDEGVQPNGSTQRFAASRDPPAPVVRSVTPGSSPPPAAMFRTASASSYATGMNQRWSQHEADADVESTRAATSQAVYLASTATLNRSESQRSDSAFANDDMEIEAQESRIFVSNGSHDVYTQQFDVASQRSSNVSYDDEDEDNKSVDSAIGREYDARNHDHIRQEALRMLEVADADTHYSVHRTITGGFTAQPKPLGNQQRTRTALQGLNFVANSRAKAAGSSRFGNYATTATQSSPTRDDFEYGDVDSVVDVIGLETRSASAAASESLGVKSWSSRYSIDTTMLAMSGGAMKQKLDRMDRDNSMDRFSASNLFRNSPAKSPKIFGSGFDFRQQHVFGQQKVTIPTDNIQPVWNDETESPTLRARSWQEQLFTKKQQQRRWIICLIAALVCLIVPLVSVLSMRGSNQTTDSNNSPRPGGFSFADDTAKPDGDTHQPVTFYVTTDSPHNAEQVTKLTNDLAAVSKQASFAVHLGNIQDSKVTNCTKEVYSNVATLLEESSPVRVFIVPGEEDWNNCPDPDDAWDSWYDSFHMFSEKWSRVRDAKNMSITREKNIFENWAFVEQGVLFVGVHVVNGQVPDEDEFAERNQLNMEWVVGMNLLHQDQFRAMVVLGNGEPGREENKHFFRRLENYLSTYQFPALYVHSWNGVEATGQYKPFTDLPHVSATRVKNDVKSKPLLLTVGFGETPFSIA